jgi:2-polyprenyl-3-methyl-5-hydroxy-6-metoxy-1,4-benzoquinol methylase
MLEIGAGGGFFLDEAKKGGFEVYGIELNRVAASFIKEKLNIPCEDSALSEQSFCGKKFDVVYHCNVLSHLYDPIAEFRMICDRLKDGGILVFETGNIAEVKDRYFHCFSNFGFPDHLFFFGEETLKQLLKLTGFDIVKMYRYSILGSLLTHKGKEWVRNMIKSASQTSKSSIENTVKNSSFNIKTFMRPLKSAYRTVLYLMDYKIGYILPKRGRPQTVIVVGRKKTSRIDNRG